MSHRVERFSSTLKQCLADILMMDIKDINLRQVMIQEVLVSTDLKSARVFISPPWGESNIDDLISRLTKASGFIRKALARRMKVKYVPELLFIHSAPLAVNFFSHEQEIPSTENGNGINETCG